MILTTNATGQPVRRRNWTAIGQAHLVEQPPGARSRVGPPRNLHRHEAVLESSERRDELTELDDEADCTLESTLTGDDADDIIDDSDEQFETDGDPAADMPAPAFDPSVWHVVEGGPEDVGDLHIRPFTIIGGIKKLNDFNTVERAIVHALVPPDQRFAALFTRATPDEAVASEPAIASDRIVNYLRPRKFVGTLLEGQVQLVPFDVERAMAHSPTLNHTMWRQLAKDPTPFPGVGALFTGILRSSTGKLGQLNVEATYFVRRSNPNAANNALHGRIGRTVGNTEVIGGIEEELERRYVESRQRALQVARYAITHTYSGGFETRRGRH